MTGQLEDQRSRPMISQIWLKSCFCNKRSTEKNLKRLKAELASKPNKAGKHEDTEPEFKFEGNKKQYQLNKNMQLDYGSQRCVRNQFIFALTSYKF